MAKKNFDSLTKAEQRVVIARDLIKRLDAKEFVAKSMVYLRAPLGAHDTADPDKQVKDALKGKICRGCQLGGFFLCAVDRYDKLRLQDVDMSYPVGRVAAFNDIEKYLRRWFTVAQLNSIETAFEGCDKFQDWASRREDDERMRLIAQNIVRNKGRFVGKQLLAA